ncbi:MAG: flagellar biosynthesis protein FliQ [Steroidobacteraceae bacterium]
MDSATVMSLGTGALEVTLALAAPLLLAALITGVVVGAFQAATQINEMTLSFIPKLLVMALVMALAGPWMLHTLVDYTRELILSIPQLVN